MSLKNSNDTIGNRTRDLPVCSVERINDSVIQKSEARLSVVIVRYTNVLFFCLPSMRKMSGLTSELTSLSRFFKISKFLGKSRLVQTIMSVIRRGCEMGSPALAIEWNS
jgi:hypothetical protein